MELKFSNFEEKISNFLEENKLISTISNILNKPTKSIYNAIQRIKTKENTILTIKKVKTGRISKISPRTKRAINRDLTRSPKKENKRLLIENNLSLSKRTLQRFLKKENYSINTTFKKPYLNKKKAATRLEFVKKQLSNLENINLNKIIFSNKLVIKKGFSSRQEYYRSRKHQRLGQKIVSNRNKGTFYKKVKYLKLTS